MKQVYANFAPQQGARSSGVCGIKILPREWMTAFIPIDFSTNTVTLLPLIVEGKDFIDISFVEETYDFKEEFKSSRAGTYFEITLKGLTNDMSPEVRQSLETLRYHDFIVILNDRAARKKIIGNTDTGMQLQFNNSETNASGGNQVIEIQLSMNSEYSSPFLNI